MSDREICLILRRAILLTAALLVMVAVLSGCRTPAPRRGFTTPASASKLNTNATVSQVAKNVQPVKEAIEPEEVPARTTTPISTKTLVTKAQLVSYATEQVTALPEQRPLSFEEAIATSLDRNPTLVTMRANEPVAHAAYHVAETYPWNPTVQVQVLPYARDKAGDLLGVNHYVWLNQTLELAHQRRHREASASAFWNQVRWNIVQAELANASQTERLYFTALYQRDLFELANQTAQLNVELRGIVERRFKAGLSTAAEQTTARIASRQSQRQQQLAKANYQTSVLVLQRQLNLQADEPFALVGRLDEFSWLPVPGVEQQAGNDTLDVLVSDESVTDLAFNRPDVLAAHAGVDVAQANADLARANQIQNLGIGPFYERDESGTVFAGLRVQGNIPVWDTGHPLTAQREAERNLQLVTFNQLRLRAKSEAQTAIERYERARRMAAHESTSLSKLSTTELDNLKKQFESGQADILNVYTVQNGLLQERRTYLDLLNEVAQSAADVTLMAGLPPACLVSHQSDSRDLEELPAPKEIPTP